MTTFALMSDVHLEHGGRNFDLPDADILLLAGDICVVDDLRDSYMATLIGQRSREFLIDVSKKYKHVVVIPGNHEYYDGTIEAVTGRVNDFLVSENINNITFNEYGCYTTGGVKVVYATLWTDMNDSCPLVISQAAGYMNDYQHIKCDHFGPDNLSRNLRPSDTLILHEKHRQHIARECANTTDKLVVMTHHAPLMSLINRERNPNAVDYCYGCTDMEDIIHDNDILVWAYGHVHTRDENVFGGVCGDTKFISNCRGYFGHERGAESFTVKTFTV